jgi:hypothetical protein
MNGLNNPRKDLSEVIDEVESIRSKLSVLQKSLEEIEMAQCRSAALEEEKGSPNGSKSLR